MKLSEAIRDGAKMCPQAFGTTEDGSGGRCALGAAMLSMGCLIHKLESHFPDLRTTVKNPCECVQAGARLVGLEDIYNDNSLAVVIAHLNDQHKWSREAIAEWVEVAEKQLEAMRVKIAPPMEPIKGEVAPEPVEPVKVTV